MDNPWKSAFFTLMSILILFSIAGVAYLLGKYGILSPLNPTNSVQVEQDGNLQEDVSEQTERVVATPKPTADDSQLIKQAVYTKTGLDETEAEVTISKNTGKFATGGIKEFGAVGGAYFLAAKIETGWVAVYDGQATPECSLIEPYNFPADMVPECLGTSGDLVPR
jgi:hypothetical protein